MTKIEWTDRTWNPVRGCSRISAGCTNCYAERQAARFSDEGQYAHGFVERTASGPRWTGRVELVESKLLEPLSWTKPSRVFVNSMSDLFHERLSDTDIDKVFAVMALAPQHTFQVLTKRADRMREYVQALIAGKRDLSGGIRAARPELSWMQSNDEAFIALGVAARENVVATYNWTNARPLPNVWLGVSCEDQASADKRIPDLLATPAAVRFLSCEPLIGPIDLRAVKYQDGSALFVGPRGGVEWAGAARQLIGWCIAGGESGHGARACDISWIRSIVKQCKDAKVPVFVKQLGANVECANDRVSDWLDEVGLSIDYVDSGNARFQGDPVRVMLRDRKGGDPGEWPEVLRVREFPKSEAFS